MENWGLLLMDEDRFLLNEVRSFLNKCLPAACATLRPFAATWGRELPLVCQRSQAGRHA